MNRRDFIFKSMGAIISLSIPPGFPEELVVSPQDLFANPVGGRHFFLKISDVGNLDAFIESIEFTLNNVPVRHYMKQLDDNTFEVVINAPPPKFDEGPGFYPERVKVAGEAEYHGAMDLLVATPIQFPSSMTDAAGRRIILGCIDG